MFIVSECKHFISHAQYMRALESTVGSSRAPQAAFFQTLGPVEFLTARVVSCCLVYSACSHDTTAQ